MVKDIVKDTFFLSGKSDEAVKDDLPIITDLKDTLAAHKGTCVGMAANMIGYKKKIIIVDTGFMPLVMVNPQITSKTGPYKAKEGCLSLSGVRETTRYEKITVSYQNASFNCRQQNFEGGIAQIIQHEVDHLSGILI